MAQLLLETRQLNFFFDGLHAVRDLDLAVNEGNIHAVIGPNGAGKTTLFNIISGVLRPKSGLVKYAGRDITGLPSHAIAAIGIARTFQTTRLFPRMSVVENVQVGRHTRSRSGFLSGMFHLPRTWTEERKIKDDALSILDKLGLSEHADKHAGILPFGHQRLVEFARALAMEPSLILLDEPATGLNIYETAQLAKLIMKIRDWGITVLIVEHDMSLVMEISDAVVVLHQGSKVAEGKPAEIQKHPEVNRIYLGEDNE